MKNAIKKTVSILRLLFGAIILGLAYKTGAQWPFDITNLSLSGCRGSSLLILISLKYKYAIISVIDNEPPGWPLPAAPVAIMTPFLMFAAVFFKARIYFCSINTTLSIKMQNAQ
jgi:hypothetical protein